MPSDYREFIQEVNALDFIKDEATADAAVKAVLGILVSRLEEPQAYRLTETLPAPLSLGRLRGHQTATALMISFEQYIKEISVQFRLNYEQAHLLVNTVLRRTRKTIDRTLLDELITHLPPDWSAAVIQA